MANVDQTHGGKQCTTVHSFLVITGLLAGVVLFGQEVPSKPLSIPVYNPLLINPAFAGSKDFTNIGLTTKALKYPDSQVLNVHKRLSTANGDYSNLGFGAFVFQEQWDASWNSGIGLTGSYHYALDDKKLHNLAGGVTVKGILNMPKKGAESIPDTASVFFHPNLDLGIYYYGPSAFAGISVTTLLDPARKEDTLYAYSDLHRGYHFYGGYKFVLSKQYGIVLEPSLLVSLDDNTFSEAHKHLVPYLKLYLQNFYIGTYLKDLDILALFFQYQFPRLYTGVFLEFPRVGFLNDDNIIMEVSLGVNLGRGVNTSLQYRHW
jgi:type IX secretion system PorP/SprF family membrane protein